MLKKFILFSVTILIFLSIFIIVYRINIKSKNTIEYNTSQLISNINEFEGDYVFLQEITPFAWDKVYILGPFTNKKICEKIINKKINCNIEYKDENDSGSILFMYHDSPVCYIGITDTAILNLYPNSYPNIYEYANTICFTNNSPLLMQKKSSTYISLLNNKELINYNAVNKTKYEYKCTGYKIISENEIENMPLYFPYGCYFEADSEFLSNESFQIGDVTMKKDTIFYGGTKIDVIDLQNLDFTVTNKKAGTIYIEAISSSNEFKVSLNDQESAFNNGYFDANSKLYFFSISLPLNKTGTSTVHFNEGYVKSFWVVPTM